MKRLSEIVKGLNTKFSIIQKQLEGIGQTVKSPNERIQPDLEEIIIKLHSKSIKKLNQVFDSPFYKATIIKEFNQLNPFKREQYELILLNGDFSDRTLQILEWNNIEYQTIFTNFEAYSICRGLENNSARKIAKDFFKSPENFDRLINAHEFAMAAYKKYGGELLIYLISLPPLPSDGIDAFQIFHELDKRKNNVEFPFLRILFENEELKKEKIQLSFFTEKNENKLKRNENIILIKNLTTGNEIMKISRNGMILPSSNAPRIIPIIRLIVRFSKNTKEMILNYGLETKECSSCGRELTQTSSILKGIGPICSQYL